MVALVIAKTQWSVTPSLRVAAFSHRNKIGQPVLVDADLKTKLCKHGETSSTIRTWLQLEAQARAEGKDPPSRGTSKCDCTSTHGLQNHTDTEPVEPPTCVAKMLPRMAKLLPAITAEELRANPISVAIEKVRGTARKRAAWGVQRGGGGALKAAHLEFLSPPPIHTHTPHPNPPTHPPVSALRLQGDFGRELWLIRVYCPRFSPHKMSGKRGLIGRAASGPRRPRRRRTHPRRSWNRRREDSRAHEHPSRTGAHRGHLCSHARAGVTARAAGSLEPSLWS